MPSKVLSFILDGLNAIPAPVEVDISQGLPSFSIVGLADTAVQESRERVRSALKNSGFTFPLSRITVNLAPAAVKKEGTYFDLPIALGILISSGQINSQSYEGKVFLGELSLSGELKAVRGLLPIVRRAFLNGYSDFIIPCANSEEAAFIKGAKIYPCSNLREVYSFLNGDLVIEPLKACNGLEQTYADSLDFGEIKGQEVAKRALEVAVAGGHHVLMIGSPGAGKTMLAKRILSVMPKMTYEEILEITEIKSIAGLLIDGDPLSSRPFRAPHHSISYAGLIGGGAYPVPGEVSLAHNGILFMDEFPEFRRDAIEALRQPLEEGKVNITRVHGTVSYPANFMLVAAMNPCPCGYYLDPVKPCRCGPGEVKRYWHKVSGPILDRFDMRILIPPLTTEELISTEIRQESAPMRERIAQAREIQLKRYEKCNYRTNSQLQTKELRKYCALGLEERTFIEQATEKFHLTARSYDRILKLSRTIADLDGEERIKISHLAEALQFRGNEEWI